ncbi:unnamed protein product [Pleuronectes platessa]|uniref:Uncharacterized protein n=1 Tax=Pleuronectes platessa TaxID=8262 RepID=A0A9N7Y1N8_PLEPL|nr:unnamed protein product [Pleuronectes platessa]
MCLTLGEAASPQDGCREDRISQEALLEEGPSSQASLKLEHRQEVGAQELRSRRSGQGVCWAGNHPRASIDKAHSTVRRHLVLEEVWAGFQRGEDQQDGGYQGMWRGAWTRWEGALERKVHGPSCL